MKIKVHKLNFSILVIVLLFVSACKKDDTPSAPAVAPVRGALESVVKVSSLTAIGLRAALSIAIPDYFNQVNYNHDVDLYKIRYYTIDPKQNIVLASGLMVVPSGVTTQMPLLAYFHGTSEKKSDVPSAINMESYLGCVMGTEGYVTILPDYLGLGDGTGMHPYLHANSEATCAIDMILVCKDLCKKMNIMLSSQLFLCGYSQGGHVTMAVQKMIESQYVGQLSITASAPMAGPYDVSGTQKNMMLSANKYPAPVYMPYMLYAFNSVYSLYPDLSVNFTAPYASLLPSYFPSTGFTDLTPLLPQMPSSGIPSEMLAPAFLNSLSNDPTFPYNLAFKENDLYNWTPKSPMKLCHCDADQHVPQANSTVAVAAFKQNGVTVELVNPLAGGNHITCVIPSIMYVKQWFAGFKN